MLAFLNRIQPIRKPSRRVFRAFIASVLIFGIQSCSCDEGFLQTLSPLITPSRDEVVFSSAWETFRTTEILRLRSSGSAPLLITAIDLDTDAVSAGFDVTVNLPIRLQPGQEESVEVGLLPNELGLHSGVVTVQSDAENDPSLVITLRATSLDAPNCDDGNPCTENTFDASDGACKTQELEDDLVCDDGNACTLKGICVSGTCLTTPLVCPESPDFALSPLATQKLDALRSLTQKRVTTTIHVH